MIKNYFNQVLSDFKGLTKVCGITVSIKWILMLIIHFNECIKTKNLQPADIALGAGPFFVKRKIAKAKLKGAHVISGIREIWVRDVYLKNDFLKIPDDGLIVDLGANMGNFSSLALAHNDKIKLIAVEPNKELNKSFMAQIDLNGWTARVVLYRNFIGLASDKQKLMLNDPDSKDAKFITAEEFINLNNLKKIEFLKCDIEGSEFELIEGEAPLLRITNQLAIEIHDFAGDRNYFITRLKDLGFTIGPIKNDPDGCIALAKRM